MSKKLSVSPSTTGLYVDQLIADGYLTESGVTQGAMGRPRRILKTEPNAGLFAGIEFNASRMQATGVDFSGQKISGVSRALPPGITADEVLQTIIESVASLRRSTNVPLRALGIGVPGLVDPDKGTGLHYAFIPDWNDVPVVKRIQSALGVSVIIQNNLRAIALAERWFGLGHDLSDYVILGPRSGFGLALVKDGRLVNGAHHVAGEMGRWPWPLGSESRGNRQLQHEMSATAVWRRLTHSHPDAPIPSDLRSALAAHEASESDEWLSVCRDFANVLGCVQFLIDTQLFILHGPLTALGERFCERIVTLAHERFPALEGNPLRLLPSGLGDDAGALGAVSLAMESWQPA
ncbi:MAG: ROK family protein [Prosthecobacter sp.]